MSRPSTVVLSQAQGKHPAKRSLEESIVAALIMEPGLDVSVVPYLYDLGPDHTGRLFLESVQGDMVVLSWLYPRAAFWLLDRDGIKGHYGETQLKPPADDEDEDEDRTKPAAAQGHRLPSTCRIGTSTASTCATSTSTSRTSRSSAHRRGVPRPPRGEGREGRRASRRWCSSACRYDGDRRSRRSPRSRRSSCSRAAGRRWYPVIDYSRCTNCMECLDFCLFGVYGVDKLDRILVENQDNCKKGCPACSRVCPEQAIMFPDYKTPAIAGRPGRRHQRPEDRPDQAVRRRRGRCPGDGRPGARPRTGRRRPRRGRHGGRHSRSARPTSRRARRTTSTSSWTTSIISGYDAY